MTLDDALEEKLSPMRDDIEALKAQVAGNGGHIQGLTHDLTGLAKDVEALKGNPPADDGPIVVDPPTGNTRRFGCNIGYKIEKAWSPDKPDHPRYDEIIAPFGGFRFMDWWKVNDDLNPGTGITDEEKAMLDTQIDLCNRHNSHMYLCFRFLDSDDTVQYKVDRVRSRLKPGLTRYVEWTNEPWNYGFQPAKEIMRLSGASHLGEARYHETWARFASRAFRSAKRADPDCVTVLGCLTANSWVAEKVDEQLSTKPDAHGLTFYFGAGLGGTPPTNASVEDIIASANNKITQKELGRMRDSVKLAKSLGRRIVGYEGGPHLRIDPKHHESHKVTWQNMNRANRDPRILPLIERVVSEAESLGFENLFWFNLVTLYDQWGSWGLGEDLDTIEQSEKYKYASRGSL